MGLEALTPTTYISGFTQSWPTAGEPKSQGDDHIRLIKGVLQNTFPNATRPFYAPTCVDVFTTTTLTVAHDGAFVTCVTNSGPVGIILPALTTANTGWQVRVMKYGWDTNFVNVAATAPTGGPTIYSQVGGTPLIRIGQVIQPAHFVWDGGSWFCSKSGGLIGETINFDGPNVPPGFSGVGRQFV